MCTLIALHRCFSGVPLVVAANRDEFLERPAERPALRDTPYGAIVAPLDRRAGGTWLGVNGAGVFAAVTNRRCASPDPRRRSRGLLVVDALGAPSAEEAVRRLEGNVAGAYNPFNLFVADRRAAFALSCAETVRVMELRPGIHVIGNLDLEGPTPPSLERLRDQAGEVADGPAERALAELAQICRGHDGAPLDAICVHAGDYGTRSSTLLQLADSQIGSALRHAEGAPCRTEYRDFTPLLRDLGRVSGSVEGSSLARKAS